MSRNIAVGIDIGTYQVKVVVTETKDGKPPRIIGAGMAESKGLRHGYILNSADVTKSIRSAVAQAEKTSGIKIKKSYLALGGVGLQSITQSSSIIISRADSEVTDLDISKVSDACERDIPKQSIVNRKIIHSIPLHYKIDGRTVLGRPQGMKGTKLEAKTLFITCIEQHLNDIIDALNDAHIEVLDVVTAPLAASIVTLTKTQKLAGCVLANIGAETVSIVVFEDNLPISLEVFPIGSTDITNDIALGLRVPLEEAETIKRGDPNNSNHSRKKLDEIVVARLSDIFELIEAHLKKIDKNGLLPAGIIITGGGSGIATIEDMAKATLKLPSRVASLGGNARDGVKDATWAVAYGLCLFGLSEGGEDISGISRVKTGTGKIIEWSKKLIKQLLP
ncbi:MAG TPA: cell division protein FtsA [Candidatus Paceibacterota bacterium]|jgi:cell division protein FtsA|nr:cell division protein FtsA [Candidatus Paceibacterota bacterium]